MSHHEKKQKGDLAVAKIIADLTVKEFAVFIPAITEHLPFDLIAYKDNTCYRIQCKYSSDGEVKRRTSWSDKNGTHTKEYGKDDFDYFGIYLPSLDKCIYPNISFGGCTVRTSLPNAPTPFYWWEDFQSLTDAATKKTFRDFNYKIVK